MKKSILLTFMMMVSLCLSAQNVNDFISEKTKDGAYVAPNTMFINKKWYVFDEDFDINTNYYIFRENKTGEIVKPMNYANCSYEEVVSFTWSRDHNNLTLSFNTKKMAYYRKLVYKDPSASERNKGSIKEAIQDDINERNNQIRVLDSYIIKYYINRLDAKLFLLEGLKIVYKGLGESREKGAEDLFLCTEAGEKEIEESKKEVAAKKAEEDKQRAKEAEEREAKKKAEAQKEAEEKKLNEELQAMNKEAYSYAREGKLDEAIATIDKVIELQPQNPNWYDTKGEFLAKKGDREGAKAMWEKVISLDPDFGKNNSPLSSYIQLLSYEGWHMVDDSFPKSVPFKKIRVKMSSGVPSDYCYIFFTTEPNSNSSRKDTQYGINYNMNWIYNGKSYYDKRFKKCIDVGDGWFEYEYSQPMYFSHIQKNVPKDCLKVLVEVK